MRPLWPRRDSASQTYVLRVRCRVPGDSGPASEWTVHRRYREFRSLHQTVRSRAGSAVDRMLRRLLSPNPARHPCGGRDAGSARPPRQAPPRLKERGLRAQPRPEAGRVPAAAARPPPRGHVRARAPCRAAGRPMRPIDDAVPSGSRCPSFFSCTAARRAWELRPAVLRWARALSPRGSSPPPPPPWSARSTTRGLFARAASCLGPWGRTQASCRPSPGPGPVPLLCAAVLRGWAPASTSGPMYVPTTRPTSRGIAAGSLNRR